jgi:hypothetical protein
LRRPAGLARTLALALALAACSAAGPPSGEKAPIPASEPPTSSASPSPTATDLPQAQTPAPSNLLVQFAGLRSGTYPVHLHSVCNGTQTFHITVLQSLRVAPDGTRSVEVPAADVGRGWCLIVYTDPSLARLLAVRPI